MPELSFTKYNDLHQVKTTITANETELRGTRVIYGKLRTITTGPCSTMGEFATRANNMCSLTNCDFEMMEDFDETDEFC